MIEALNLFAWKSEVNLRTTSGSVKVHLRTLSSVQDELRTDGAMAASRLVQAQLDDESSAPHINHIAPLKELGQKGLIGIITQLQRGLFIRDSRWAVEPYANPEPPQDTLQETQIVSRPDIKDMTKWKDTEDSLRRELEEKRAVWVKERMDSLEEELAEMDVDALREIAIGLHQLSIMDRAWNKEWDYQTIFHGSYKDEKCTKSFWKEVHEVRELPKHIFSQVAAAYRELDEYSYNLEKLKNLS